MSLKILGLVALALAVLCTAATAAPAIQLDTLGPVICVPTDGDSTFGGILLTATVPGIELGWVTDYLRAALVVRTDNLDSIKVYPGVATNVSLDKAGVFAAGVAWLPGSRYESMYFLAINLSSALGIEF